MSAAAVIFVHVPKTAGLTVREILRRQCRRSELYVPRVPDGARAWVLGQGDLPREHRGAQDRNRIYLEHLAAMPEEGRRRLRILMGHFWFGLHEALSQPSTYVALVRDPVERVLSLYHHRVTRHGLRAGIDEYVREARDWEIDNGQTRRLAGGSTGDLRLDPCTEATLERAVTNLRERFGVVGVTERFDETLVLMGRAFGWRDLRYAPQNVSERRLRRDQLSAETLSSIEERNRHDAELHRIAGEMLSQRISADGRGVEREVRRLRLHRTLYRTGRAIPGARALRRLARRAVGSGATRAGEG